MKTDIPDEAMKAHMVELLVIRDKETKEVLLRKRGDDIKDIKNERTHRPSE